MVVVNNHHSVIVSYFVYVYLFDIRIVQYTRTQMTASSIPTEITEKRFDI